MHSHHQITHQPWHNLLFALTSTDHKLIISEENKAQVHLNHLKLGMHLMVEQTQGPKIHTHVDYGNDDISYFNSRKILVKFRVSFITVRNFGDRQRPQDI